ncbi:methionine import ATP-binding protein MetN [Companilactobacillus sp. RD055328]|uniref:methionine ABC transporter ATP-binding protein n=1 Tax=Companilactobacillus sp. RD055328 TaxID=2916634 RepID=UPI001FC7E966|nr:ATP-binding cassette domain-containing protein [Companilactobacillus sp. RD055328]GKQ43196.1 methionine import ATP-binding protein MetN [Companilactobacillus sp. RD055328]
MITVQNVNKTFVNKNQEFSVLHDVSLEIPEGVIYGIIGYSGAGKSTLIRLFNGLETPTSGDIKIDGQSIVNINKTDLRLAQQQIGMVFQQFNLLASKTVLENVALPLKLIGVPKEQRQKRALEILEIVGLNDHDNKYPNQLSGGQKQRVAIARALIRNPKILLCDEATSALDPEATSSILKLLAKINREMKITIVMVTHEMEAVRRICQQIAVMESGKIVETGSVTQIFEHPNSAITKSIISESQLQNDIDAQEVLKEIKQNATSDSAILKLTFVRETVRQAVISEISREYPKAQFSILGGQLQPTIEGVMGYLIVQIQATEDLQEQIIKNLNTKQVQVEVI